MSLNLNTSTDAVVAAHTVTTSRITFDISWRLVALVVVVVCLVKADLWAFAWIENFHTQLQHHQQGR